MAISRLKAALLVAALCATARMARADCPEGTPQAACMIDEEGAASPIAAPRRPQPPVTPPPVGGRPLDAPVQPQTTPQPFRCATLAIGMTVLSQGAELPGVGLGLGLGLFGLVERRAGKSLGLTFRADYVSHRTDDSPLGHFTGFELMTLAGLRTMTRIVHARIEAGVTRSTMEALARSSDPSIPLHTVSWTDIYPVIGIGGGLHVGRVRLHASVLYAANFAAEPNSSGYTPQMPLRFMGVLGVDLWRR